MRYLHLAIAVLCGLSFVMLQIPESRIGVHFLSSFIELPSNSLATLSFLLGAVTGAFVATFICSLFRSRSHLTSATGGQSRSGA